MNAGTYLGGVRTVEDLRLRCRLKECGCWEWAMAKSSNGTPSVSMLVDGKRTNMNGRRAALTLAKGKAISKRYVATAADHCENDFCVNPDHCRLTTLSQLRKEQANNATPSLRSVWVRNGVAQANRLAKLTADQALAIRDSEKSAKELAKDFGISVSNVHRIRSGKQWRDPSNGLSANSSVFNWRPAA